MSCQSELRYIDVKCLTDKTCWISAGTAFRWIFGNKQSEQPTTFIPKNKLFESVSPYVQAIDAGVIFLK